MFSPFLFVQKEKIIENEENEAIDEIDNEYELEVLCFYSYYALRFQQLIIILMYLIKWKFQLKI